MLVLILVLRVKAPSGITVNAVQTLITGKGPIQLLQMIFTSSRDELGILFTLYSQTYLT